MGASRSGTGAGGCLVRRFAAVAAAATFVQGVYFGYLVSVLTSVERRFSLSSGQSGGLLSAYDLGHAAAVLVVGHYGGRVHQPRCIAALSLLCALSCVGLAAPHALARPTLPLDRVADAAASRHTFGMCHDANAAASAKSAVHRAGESPLPLAFCMLAVSQLVAGVGGAAFDVLTYVYVDDNASAKRSPHYLGVISAMFGYGPAAGFLLGALTANMPLDLLAPSAGQLGGGGHGQPAGAWWLGLLVCAALFALVAVPFALFPKSVGDKGSGDCEEKVALEKVRECSVVGVEPASSSLEDSAKGVARNVAELCGNALFLWLTVMWTCDAFLFGGADTFGPKYLEEHFGQSTSAANIITAAMTVCGTATATVMGGRLLSALDLSPRTGLLLLLCAKVTGVAALFAGAFIACPSAPAAAWAADASGSPAAPLSPLCDSACACDPRQFAPVCLSYGTEDAVAQYSACVYACRNATMPLDSANCPCLKPNETLASGYCEENVTCQGRLVAFLIVNFSQAFSNGLFVVAGYTALLKAVAKEKKSFALAINTFVVSIFGYMPSQVAFGALFDLACVQWAAGAAGTGSCLAYDRRSLRLNFNLAAAGVAALATLAGLMAWRAATRFDWPDRPKVATDDSARRRDEVDCCDDRDQKRDTSYYPYDVRLCHEIGMLV